MPDWKLERTRYQRGLLSWLQQPDDGGGLMLMLTAVEAVLESSDGSSHQTRLFWQSVASFLRQLLEGRVKADEKSRRLCARIDLSLRELQEGQGGVSAPDQALVDAVLAYAGGSAAHDAGQGDANGRSPGNPGLPPALSLAGTLSAAAELLPLMSHPRERLSPGLKVRWLQGVEEAGNAWSTFRRDGSTSLRRASTQLLLVATEAGDAILLQLSEMVATLCDWIDDDERNLSVPHLAVGSAIMDELRDPDHLDHPRLGERTRLLANRLRQVDGQALEGGGRTPSGAQGISVLVPASGGGLSFCPIAAEVREVAELLVHTLDMLPPDRDTFLAESRRLSRLGADHHRPDVERLALALYSAVRRLGDLQLDQENFRRPLLSAIDVLGSLAERVVEPEGVAIHVRVLGLLE